MTDIREDRISLSRNLESPQSQERFRDQVADDFGWTVEGTHPLADATAARKSHQGHVWRLGRSLQDGVALQPEHLYIDGDAAIAELLSSATTNEDAPFDNHYCWDCRFDGDTIIEVRAYLDSAMVSYTVLRNEPAAKLS